MTCLSVRASTSFFLYPTLLPGPQSNLAARDPVLLMRALNNEYMAADEKRVEDKLESGAPLRLKCVIVVTQDKIISALRSP
jgi:hypothetical protein